MLQAVLLVSLVHAVALPPTCGPGTFLENNSCHPCLENTFISEEYHSKISCDECSKFHDQSVYYDFISECNSTHDAVIKCKNHTYRHNKFGLLKDPCLICTNCTLLGYYEKTPCSENENAVCCPEMGKPCASNTSSTVPTTPAPDVRKECVMEEIFKSKNKTFTVRSENGCLNGEHYVCDGQNSVVCSPCPTKTYMNESHHFQPACRPCDSKSCNMTFTREGASDPDCFQSVVVTTVINAMVATVIFLVIWFYRYCRDKNKSGIYNIKNESGRPEEKLDLQTCHPN